MKKSSVRQRRQYGGVKHDQCHNHLTTLTTEEINLTPEEDLIIDNYGYCFTKDELGLILSTPIICCIHSD